MSASARGTPVVAAIFLPHHVFSTPVRLALHSERARSSCIMPENAENPVADDNAENPVEAAIFGPGSQRAGQDSDGHPTQASMVQVRPHDERTRRG